MTFEVGDRVRYVNKTSTSCPTAVGHIGTVVKVSNDRNNIVVKFDERCWVDGRDTTNLIAGLWKWELVSKITQKQIVIRKCQDLTRRFNNKQLKTKSKPLPFPKEVKYV